MDQAEIQRQLILLNDLLHTGEISQDAFNKRVAALVQAATAEKQSIVTIAQDNDVTAIASRGVGIGRDNSGIINTGVFFAEVKIFSDSDLEEAKKITETYLRWLIKVADRMPLATINNSKDDFVYKSVKLRDIYIKLNTTHSMKLAVDKRRSARDYSDDDYEIHQVSVMEALCTHQVLTLLGAPGSGKSTFGEYVLSNLALNNLNVFDDGQNLGSLLPIRVSVQQLAKQFTPGVSKGNASLIWNYLRTLCEENGLPENTVKYLKTFAHGGGAFFVFDGLDGCGSEEKINLAKEAIANLIDSISEKSRVLITARPYTYPEGANAKEGRYLLADFSPQDCIAFVEKWFNILQQPGQNVDSQSITKKFAEAIKQDAIYRSVCNPLMLTLAMTLYTDSSQLLENRTAFYEEMVDLLLSRWQKNSPTDEDLLAEIQKLGVNLEQVKRQLALFAYRIHENSQPDEQSAFDEEQLSAVFANLLKNRFDLAIRLVGYISNRTGLIVEHESRGSKRYFSFPHQTLQEYMAALYLADSSDFEKLTVKLAVDKSRIDHWQPVLMFAAAIAKTKCGSDVANALVRGEYPDRYFKKTKLTSLSEPEVTWQRAIIAAEQLIEIGLNVVKDERLQTLERVSEWLAELVQNGILTAKQRRYAGRLLAQLGDPRRGISLDNGIPDIDWCDIPAGEFLCGPEKMVVNIPYPFKISKYPVSYAQFNAFIHAEQGWQQQDNWINLDANTNHRTHPGEQRFKYSNHPCENVSWFDAIAFCRWLSKESGQAIRLPTEQEWERAARGVDGRIYPWGNEFSLEHANIAESTSLANVSSLEGTTPIGMYPTGTSVDGVRDMSGNVLEWCLNEYLDPDRKQLQGAKWRAIRGGAWDLDQTRATCTHRDASDSIARKDNIGFRVVLSNEIV